MRPLKGRNTRCNFCSLGCFLGVTRSAGGYVAPEYGHDVPPLRQGVCNRGNMTAELLDHVLRVVAARDCSADKPRDMTLESAITRVAGAVAAEGATLVIDGNLPCEDIAAGLALAAASNGKITADVQLPVEDASVLDGLSASGAAWLTPEDLATCDAILIVGDAFATHPMMVRPVHELRRRNARLPVVVVDSLVGKTSIFATHPVMVKPGTESRVLAAIAAKLGAVVTGALAIDAAHAAPEAGLPADVIAGAAGVLAGSKKLGVIVRAEIGKASNWDQVGMLAGLIAAAKNGGVAACLTYGNAMGAWRLARAAGVARTEPAANVIALGADLVSVLSREECAATLDGVKMLAAAGAMPSPTLGAADVVLPMALNFEAGGTTVTGSGEIITVDSLADAPGDALPARELLNRFAKALGSSSVERAVDVKALEKPPAGDAQHLADRGQPGLSSAPAGEFQAVTWSDAVHFHTGTLTAQCQWPLYMANGPVVLLNANDSGELGIRENDRVQLTSEKAQGEAKAQLVKGQTPGVVAVSGGFPAMRGLFGWSKSRPAGPVFVKVKKA